MVTVAENYFRSAVSELADEYLGEYGVREVTYDSYMAKVDMEHCSIGFYLDLQYVFISVQPHYQGSGAIPKAIGLGGLVDEDRRNEVKRAGRVYNAWETLEPLRWLIRILIECCGEMLGGDFSRWGDIEAHVAAEIEREGAGK